MPFTAIVGLRELPNGDIIVIEGQDPSVHLLAADGRTARSIARSGAGPGEVRSPRAALSIGVDSTAILDVALRRVLLLDGQGATIRHIPAPDGFGEMLFSATQSVNGRYVVVPARWSARGADGIVPLLRWDLHEGVVDTVGRIARAGVPRAMRGPDDHFPDGQIVPYAPNDVVVPSAFDGFAVLHANDYRLSMFGADGAVRRRGPPIKTSRVQTSERERAMMPPGVIPDEKPPFTEFGHFVEPSGVVWVRRSRAAGTTSITMDLIDPSGTLLGSVVLTDGARIVGIGARGIYVTRVDEDGFQFLERLPLTRFIDFKPTPRQTHPAEHSPA